jgi:CHAD domain-containing protein
MMDAVTSEAAQQSILPSDTVRDAGRKVLLAEFAKANQDEDSNPQVAVNVQDMQIKVRYIQGALKLLKSQTHTKAKGRYKRSLNRLSHELNNLRDLDYLIADLQTFGSGIDSEHQNALQSIIEKLQARRNAAVEKLVTIPNGKAQARFERSLAKYIAVPESESEGAQKVTPSQVRHVLPRLIYNRIGAIQAYETTLVEASPSTLKSLQTEFKRLQNILALFESVLGKQIAEFNKELNSLLITLEQLHDSANVQSQLKRYIDTGKKKYASIIEAYVKYRADQDQALTAEFKQKWDRFNSRKVQQKLSTALLDLYNN